MITPLRFISHVSSRPLAVPKLLSTYRISFRTFAMTSTHDTSLQADIGKMKLEADGSYNRAASSFKNSIQKGGRFTPERGLYSSPDVNRNGPTRNLLFQTDITSMSRTHAVGNFLLPLPLSLIRVL